MKVLVVDDNETFRRQTARYLGMHDINVEAAARGKEALDMMRSRRYDVVLLDLKMPDLGGLEVLRQAQADGIGASFIMVTGYGDVSSAVEAMKNGAVDFIEKPFDPEQLLDAVQETGAARQEPASTAARLRTLLAERDADTAVLLVAEQPAQVEQLLSFEPDERLSLEAGERTLADLTNAIDAFIERHDRACIVHAGIHHLYCEHESKAVDRYLTQLHRHAEADAVTLLVLYDTSIEQEITDRIVDDTDVALFVEEVIATLDHPIRRDILNLLEHNDVLQYSFFLKHMGIDYSAKLAFHLNRLQGDDLVEKTEQGYRLTERGHSFATLYQCLLLQRHHDAGNSVLYVPLSRENEEAGGGI